MTSILHFLLLSSFLASFMSVEAKASRRSVLPMRDFGHRSLPNNNGQSSFNLSRFSSSFTGFSGLDHDDHMHVAKASNKNHAKKGECKCNADETFQVNTHSSFV